MCFLLVSCPLLSSPSNGMINCSLGDDEVPSYEDTCSFTCNPGYELTGSNTRTCQSNGSWSGNNAMCNRGKCFLIYALLQFLTMCFLSVSCPSLSEPSNGIINCSLGDDEVPSYEDICNFTCDTGYELTGSESRTCQSDGSWSDNHTMCNRGEGNFLSLMYRIMHSKVTEGQEFMAPNNLLEQLITAVKSTLEFVNYHFVKQ